MDSVLPDVWYEKSAPERYSASVRRGRADDVDEADAGAFADEEEEEEEEKEEEEESGESKPAGGNP